MLLSCKGRYILFLKKKKKRYFYYNNYYYFAFLVIKIFYVQLLLPTVSWTTILAIVDEF